MKNHQYYKLLVFCFVLIFLNININAQNDTITTPQNQSSEKVEPASDENNSEIIRLKKDKNELLETIREKDTSIRYIALSLTVISILLIIFFFAFLSVRRKKRIELGDLQKEIDNLKS